MWVKYVGNLILHFNAKYQLCNIEDLSQKLFYQSNIQSQIYIADLFLNFWNILHWEQTYKSIFSKDFYFWHFLKIFLAHSGKCYSRHQKRSKKVKGNKRLSGNSVFLLLNSQFRHYIPTLRRQTSSKCFKISSLNQLVNYSR